MVDRTVAYQISTERKVEIAKEFLDSIDVTSTKEQIRGAAKKVANEYTVSEADVISWAEEFHGGKSDPKSD